MFSAYFYIQRMKTRVISLRNGQLPAELVHEWQYLRDSQSHLSNPFFHPNFTKSIAKARNDVNLLTVTDGQGLAAIWPLHMSKRKIARGIGSSFSDRNGPICRKHNSPKIATILNAANVRQYKSIGLVTPHKSTDLGGIQWVASNIADLSGGVDGFFEAQSKAHKSHFKRLRRLSRRLHEAHDIEFRFDDRSESARQQILTMKRSQYAANGRHDVLAPAWVERFLNALMEARSDSFCIRLSTLWADGHLIAGELNLQSETILHGWIVAYDPEYLQFSPGHLLTELILKAMPNAGLFFYDSGVGGDHYKKYVTNHQEILGQGVIETAKSPFTLGSLARTFWMKGEVVAPKPLVTVMQKARRRTDMIMASEVETIERVRGFYHAMKFDI